MQNKYSISTSAHTTSDIVVSSVNNIFQNISLGNIAP